MKKNLLSKSFLITLVVISLVACFLIFRPFLADILTAAIFATIFYRPYEWLSKKLGGRKSIAAAIMCLLIVLVVIIPVTSVFFLAAKESSAAYGQVVDFFTHINWNSIIEKSQITKIDGIDLNSADIRSFVLDTVQKAGNFVVGGAASLIKETTSFIVSLFFILLTLFFLFIDGKEILGKIMYLTPLKNKYDKEIFKKFTDVSYTFIVSTFIVALCQGFACFIGVLVVTLPFLFNVPLPVVFLSIVATFLSIVPILGPWLIWLPAAIYLLLTGHVGAAIFLAIWGLLVISSVDNFARPLIMHKKAEVNPVFLLFAILGGIAFFGFWGLIIGPLIVAVTITIFHVYELEYKNELEK